MGRAFGSVNGERFRCMTRLFGCLDCSDKLVESCHPSSPELGLGVCERHIAYCIMTSLGPLVLLCGYPYNGAHQVPFRG